MCVFSKVCLKYKSQGNQSTKDGTKKKALQCFSSFFSEQDRLRQVLNCFKFLLQNVQNIYCQIVENVIVIKGLQHMPFTKKENTIV